MDDLKFIATVVVLFVAVLACHITRYKWRKEDAEAQAEWDNDKAYREWMHDEPSQIGAVQSKYLWLIGPLAWVFTVALGILLLSRNSGSI